MDCGRIEQVIEAFLSRYPGEELCLACVLQLAPLADGDDHVTARHLLCNTPDWEKRRKMRRCSRCLTIDETFTSRQP
jgi:hypothetical protein